LQELAVMSYSPEEKMSKDRLAEFCEKNCIKRLSLFGSALRGPLSADSDIDLLVEFEEGRTPGLFSIARTENIPFLTTELKKLIGWE
jgi:predicted nucleotidyltransferase